MILCKIKKFNFIVIFIELFIIYSFLFLLFLIFCNIVHSEFNFLSLIVIFYFSIKNKISIAKSASTC